METRSGDAAILFIQSSQQMTGFQDYYGGMSALPKLTLASLSLDAANENSDQIEFGTFSSPMEFISFGASKSSP